MGADGHERGVEEPAKAQLGLDVGDLGVELQRDAHVEDAVDLGVQDVAGQPVLRDAVAHIMPPGSATGVLDRHHVTQAGEVVGGRQAGRPGPDHQHPSQPVGFLVLASVGGPGNLPAAPERLVAQEALHRVRDPPTAESSWARLQAVSQGR